jgi:hypothetical protein
MSLERRLREIDKVESRSKGKGESGGAEGGDIQCGYSLAQALCIMERRCLDFNGDIDQTNDSIDIATSANTATMGYGGGLGGSSSAGDTNPWYSDSDEEMEHSGDEAEDEDYQYEANERCYEEGCSADAEDEEMSSKDQGAPPSVSAVLPATPKPSTKPEPPISPAALPASVAKIRVKVFWQGGSSTLGFDSTDTVAQLVGLIRQLTGCSGFTLQLRARPRPATIEYSGQMHVQLTEVGVLHMSALDVVPAASPSPVG